MSIKVIIAAVSILVIAAAAGGVAFFMNDQQSDDVTYSLEGGTNSPDNRTRYDGAMIELSDPSRTGYDFSGWYTDNGYTNKVTSVGPDDGKVTLYAKWILHNYSISYDIEPAAKNDNPQTCTIDDTVLLKDPVLKGYDFSGWYLSGSSEKVTELSGTTSDVRLCARFTPIVYSVSYHTDGASENDNPATVTIEKEILLKDPVRIGYAFGGWYTSDSFSLDSKVEVLKDIASDMDLYAKWTVIDYKVTYHIDASAENDNPATCTIDQVITLNAPVLKGYDFEGWYTSDSFSPDSKVEVLRDIASDVDLYAKMIIIEYKITYHTDGAFENDNPLTVTVEDEIGLNDPVKAYYSFGGWYTSDSFSPDSKVEVLRDIASDIDLYAKWTAVDYKITYHIDGAFENDNPSTVTVEDEIGLNDPIRIGYTFGGWYTSDSYSLDSRTYVLKDVTGNMDLYAKWDPITYTITYSDCGASVNLNPTSCVYTDTVVLSDPLRINYNFIGWYSDEALTDKITELREIHADTTVYAKYSELSGKKYQYSISGTASTGGIVYGLSGTLTARYSNYHDGQYLYSVGSLYDLTYDGDSHSFYSYVSSASAPGTSDSPAFSGGSFSEMEYIDTIDGRIWAFKIVDEQDYAYYGSNGTLYQGYQDSNGIITTFMLTSVTDTAVKDSYTVNIEHSNAITSVTGNGTYAAGDSVGLSYILSSGCTFKYWIPQDMDTDIVMTSITVNNISEDLDLYAWCYGDAVFVQTYDDPSWTVTDGMTDSTVFTSDSNKIMVNVPAGHYYVFSYTGKTSGWWAKTVSETYYVSGGGSATMTYSWTYSSVKYTMEWTADVDKYVEYRQKEQDTRSQSSDASENTRFVEYNEQYVNDFASILRSKVSGLTEYEFATYILCFVQEAIPYELDSDYNGMDEYWKYPYETLFDMSGDCEDTSILYCTLMKAYGYDSALLVYTGLQYIGKGHCAASVYVEGATGSYYTKDDVNYYYCETTGTGWKIGEIPSGYSTAYMYVIP